MEFRRPTGALADTKELEYVSALHQTSDDVRSNATVSSLDILHFLRSRYNMTLTHDQALAIVRGLSGDAYHRMGDDRSNKAEKSPDLPVDDTDGESSTREERDTSGIRRSLLAMRERRAPLLENVAESDGDDDKVECATNEIIEEYLDLVQILSTLLIPSFARLATDGISKHTDNGNREKQTDDIPLQDAVRNFFAKSKQRNAGAPPTPNIFQCALSSMLCDLPSDQHIISEDLIEYILLKYGEIERAQDKNLIRAMVDLANTSSSATMTQEALLGCSTNDLGPWDVISERSLSSFYYDVFGEDDISNLKRVGDAEDSKDEELMSGEKGPTIEPSEMVHQEVTNIDLVTDSHHSLGIVVLIWIFFFGLVFMYGSEVIIVLLESAEECSLDELVCTFLYSVISWAVTGILFSLFGILQIAPLSIGNDPVSTSAFRKIGAALVAVFLGLFPYLILSTVIVDDNEIVDELSNATKIIQGNVSSSNPQSPAAEPPRDDLYVNFADAMRKIVMSFGLLLAFLYVILAAKYTFKSLRNKIEVILPSELFASHAVRGYTSMKRAANIKVTKILTNAYILHADDAAAYFREGVESAGSSAKKHSDVAMRNFVLYSGQTENVGGVLWTLKRLLARSLFEEEGIWINSRLVTIQVGQLIASTCFIAVLFAQVPIWAENAQRTREDLPDGVPQWVIDMIPKSWMIKVSMYPAVASAAAVCIILIALYIPSTVATILKYRSQIKPSIGDPSFLKYRLSMDTTHMNLANAVYGLIAAAGLWYLTVFIMVFIFVWPITRDGAKYFTAWLLGLCITIGLKIVLTGMCRSAQYRSFFRIRPGGARLASLALECWFIGLGGGVLITRLGQFIAGAFFWIGRIDVYYLSEDVSVFGLQLDLVPSYFIKDILVHEAHRHPYMERLAQMYVMKAQHRSTFVTEAGAAWRQLILLAYMPWLSKYRVFGEERREQALEALRKRDKLKNEESDVKNDDEKGE